MQIKKVINNNILCVVNDAGEEMIVTGKGLGYQRRPGDTIDPDRVEKFYHMENQEEQKKLRELCEQIPLEYLRLTEDLIQYIKGEIASPLNESLLITLADHISFAIQRHRDGLEFSNPLQDAIICYYPTEYRLGLRCLHTIRQRTGVELADGEAAFIALHIVNAELNTSMSVMYDITQFIEDAIQVVEYFYQKTFDRESLDFSRFVTHLRYFAQRLFQEKSLPDSSAEQDVLFQRMIARSCKRHYKCAQCIGDYVQNTYHKSLSNEELTYLTIHLKRINMGGRDDAQ